jgi:hypothetical protein
MGDGMADGRLGGWLSQAGLGLLVASATIIASAAQKQVWVSFLDVKGNEVMAFAAQTEPYAAGKLPRVGGRFDRIVRDQHGHMVSEYGYYGWMHGEQVRVVVLVYVPVAGAENRVYPEGSPQLRVEELASYTLPVGATRHLVEPKAIGFREVTLRTESRTIRWKARESCAPVRAPSPTPDPFA